MNAGVKDPEGGLENIVVGIFPSFGFTDMHSLLTSSCICSVFGPVARRLGVSLVCITLEVGHDDLSDFLTVIYYAHAHNV